MVSSTDTQRPELVLKNALTAGFSIAEIKSLVFELGWDDSGFGWNNKILTVGETIAYAQRYKQIPELWNYVAKNRPTFNMRMWNGQLPPPQEPEPKPPYQNRETPEQLIEEAEQLMLQAMSLLARAKARL